MNVLGVNTDIQPRIPFRSRQANFSEKSTKSNESDDLETGGFVFHQIRNLEYWGDEPENLTSYEDAANGTWLLTDFHVAMKEVPVIKRSLLIGGVACQEAAPQFSIAKIANKITDLRFGRTFDLMEALDYLMELVRAVKTPEDAAIRITVA
ncbi:MAG: hypothetical protein M1840_001217 [Geoglossum simile]|nr:MAG: hypothetical protein M1840_001217 [Geoglossum simile]